MKHIPLSPYSLLFFNDFIQRPDSSEYNISFTQRVTGDFDPIKLEQSFHLFLDDHPVFDSHITLKDNKPYWIKNTNKKNIIQYDKPALTDEIIKKPFNIMLEPLYRIAFYRTSTDSVVLTVVFHHLIIDGRIQQSVFDMISQYYNGGPRVEPLSREDIAERNQLALTLTESLNDEAAREHWESIKSLVPETLALPFQSQNKADASAPLIHPVQEVRFSLSKIDYQSARKISQRPFIIFSQIWATLLARCSSQKVIPLFYPLAIKKMTGMQMGSQVNSSLMLVDVQPDSTLRQLCQRENKFSLQKNKNGDYYNHLPTQDIISHSGCSSFRFSFAQTPLRNYLFSFSGCRLQAIHDHYYDLAGADLSMEYEENDSHFNFRLRFRGALFHCDEVSRAGEYYLRLLKSALQQPDMPLSAFPLLDSNEINQLNYSPPLHHNSENLSLPQLFEKQVDKRGNVVALVSDDKYLTYNQLNQSANSLANQLINEGIKHGQSVALHCEKGIDFIIAMLAVLKTGCSYMPIAVETPLVRKQYQIEQAATDFIISQTHLTSENNALCSGFKNPVKLVYCDHCELLSLPLLPNPRINHKSSQLGTIIFTSGTTGHPKGVAVEQQAIIALVTNTNYIRLTPEDTLLFLASPTFDAATFEIWGALLNGAKLVIPASTPQLVSQTDAFKALLIDEKVSVLLITRTLFDTLYLIDNDLFDSVRQLMVGGEALTADYMQALVRKSPRPEKVLNVYGPTECTTFSSWYEIVPDCQEKSIPIGKATAGRELYVLNEHLQLQPDGAQGELYIGGQGLAQGYINDPELTQEKFIDNPYNQGKLYKSGDQVVRLSNGNLIFIGRNDSQVKIRGFRIDLSEIESALHYCDDVQQAAVLDLHHQGSHHLAAWIVSKVQGPLNDEKIREQLKALLPEFMIPAFYYPIEKIPLNISGKLDRQALLATQQQHTSCHTETSTPWEALLLKQWLTLLPGVSVSLDDNFYRVGGDSVQAILLISKLRTHGVTVSLYEINLYPTIRTLARYLELRDMERGNSEVTPAVAQAAMSGPVPLLPIQQWFFEQKNSHPHHWNQAFMLRLPENTAFQHLQDAIIALIHKHDLLRATFSQQTQFVHPLAEWPAVPLNTVQADSPADLTEQLTALQSDFNYEQGPLWATAVIRQHPAGGDWLWFAFHHLIIDAVSWRIIAQDIQHVIENKAPAPRSSSYRQWAEALADYGNTRPDEVIWWQKMLPTLPSTSLQAAAPWHQCKVSLSVIHTEKLLQRANLAWHSEINDLLLSALVLALQRITGECRHSVILEGHGREPWEDPIDLSQTVGWFTTRYPVILNVAETLTDTVILTKESLRRIPSRGLGYSVLHQQKQLGDSLLPSVSFNYLGQLDAQTHMPWSLTLADCGETVNQSHTSPLLLDINGAISRQQLSFVIDSQLAPDITDAFAQALQDALIHIVELACTVAAKKTASDYGIVPLSQHEIERLQGRYPQMIAIHRATPLQKGMIFHAIRSPTDDAYHVQQLMRYDCALNVACYKQAWNMAIETFPVLRTAFDWQGEDILQIVMKHDSPQFINYIDISELTQNEQQDKILQLQQQDRLHRFDLTQPTPMRLLVIKCQPGDYRVLKSEHHAICDGWSLSNLFQQVHQYYDRLVEGVEPRVDVQRSWPQAMDYLQRQQEITRLFWQQQKLNFTTPNTLQVMAKPAEETLQNASASQQLTLSSDACLMLKKNLANSGITLNTLLQFAWHKLINIYTQDSHTQVGIVVSGRNIPLHNIERSVGPYINTLPLTVEWQEGSSCQRILTAIQDTVSKLNSHSNIALTELQEDGIPLFESLVVCENYPQSNDPQGIAKDWELQAVFEKLDYPLVLLAFEKNNNLTLQLNYHTDWLCAASAATLLEYVVFLMNAALQAPASRHDSLTPVISEEVISLPPAVCPLSLAERFAWCVDKFSAAPALSYGQQTLNYAQLDQRASYLASQILQQVGEISPGTPIALLMDKNIDFITSLLAILKAGGCYVPLAVDYPLQRLRWMLDDIDTPLVLTQQTYLPLLENYPSLCVDLLIPQPCATVMRNVTENCLGAIIYTSGTTGTPKGVLIEQCAMLELVVDNPAIPLCAQDNLLFLSSPVFDAATFEIWGALLNGAKLVVPVASTQELASNPLSFRALLTEEKVSVMWVTRALFDNLWRNDPDLFNHLRYLLVGGEALTPDIMHRLARQPSRPQHILNGYGPTECTTFTTLAEIHASDPDGPIPIGRAITGRQVYVLNSHLQPVPDGAAGELFIGGRGLARGYLNRDDLTAHHFITQPKIPGRLYKTGDLVRKRPDGQLEYLGRKDQQVKIRGYRVELQEIEAVLNQQRGVLQSVVLLQTFQGHPQICAWCIPDPLHPFSVVELYTALECRLPDYMVPASITPTEEIPLTPNGKLARERLPAPVAQGVMQYHPPSTELEKIILAVWQQVLGVERISITDNFFRIGGDSIQSILVTTALRRQGVQCSTRDIFSAKSVQQLALLLASQPQSEQRNEQGILTGAFPLLPIQQWFFELSLAQPDWFNQAFTLTLPAGIGVETVREKLKSLVAYHDILRARFITNEHGKQQQLYSSSTDDFAFSTFDSAQCHSADELQQHCTQWQQDFCLLNGPLLRFVWLSPGDNLHPPRLFCAFHHLIIDAVSWRILAADLKTLCEGRTLEDKGTSYRQWIAQVSDYAENHLEQVSYWQQLIAQQPDYTRLAAGLPASQYREITLSGEQTHALLHKIHHAYKTEINDVLLTPLVYALSDLHGQQSSFITLEGHGRESLAQDNDLSRTVGWFTTMYPVKLSQANTLEATLRQVKDSLRQIPDKGLGYSALKYASETSVLRAHQLPAISFNYLGQFDQDRHSQDWSIDQTLCGQTVAQENQSTHLVDVVARITGGQLTVTFSADLLPPQLDKLVSEYHTLLLALLDHCITMHAKGHSWFSLSDFPHCALTLQELDRLQETSRLETIYPVTPTQREQLYFNRLNNDFQIDQGMLMIEGNFDPEIMRAAWQLAARRYDALRTGYNDRACVGKPVAVVYQDVLFPVTVEDWQHLTGDALLTALQQRLLDERLQPFNNEHPPLMRVVLVKAADNLFYMIQTFNHITIDGWSNSNLYTTLMKDYRALAHHHSVEVSSLSFAPFIAWLWDTDHEAAQDFWSAYLADAPMNQRLPTESLPAIQLARERRMRKCEHRLSQTLTHALYQFSAAQGYTVNQVTQLAWMKALAAHLPGDDIVIGTTMSERPAEIHDVDKCVGMFVASPVLRLRHIHSRSDEDMLSDIVASQPDRQQYAFHELNHYDEKWHPTSPFGSLLVFESMPAAEMGDNPPFTMRAIDGTSGSNHQTVLCLLPDANQLGFVLFYDGGEVSSATIDSVCTGFIQQLEALSSLKEAPPCLTKQCDSDLSPS